MMAGKGSRAKVASDGPKPPLRPEATSFQNHFSALDGLEEELDPDRGRERSNTGTPSSANSQPQKVGKPNPPSPSTPIPGRATEGDFESRLTALEAQVGEVLDVLRRGSNAGASSSNPLQAFSSEVESMKRLLRRNNVIIHGVKLEEFKKKDDFWAGVEKLCEWKGLDYSWPFLPFGAQRGLTPWAAEIKEVSRNSTNGTVVLCLTGLGPEGRKVLFRLKQLAREKFGWGIDDDLTPLQRQQRGQRRARMDELRQRGVKPSWRGSDVVWWDIKAARWAVEVFETSTVP